MTEPLDDVALQLGHDATHEIGEFMNQWGKRFTADNPRLVERYVNRELHLIVTFEFSGGGEQYMASFERWCGSRELDDGVGRVKMLDRPSDHRLRISPLTHTLGGHRCPVHGIEPEGYGEGQAMLVDVVELLQDPENLSVPSLVWLDTVENFDRLWLRQALYFGSGGYVLCGGVRDGEVDVPDRTRGKPSGRTEGEGQLVEGTSEVEQDFTKDNGYLWRDERVVGDHDGVDLLPLKIRVAISGNFAKVSFAEPLNRIVKLLDVAVGPLNFRPNANDRVGGWWHSGTLIDAVARGSIPT